MKICVIGAGAAGLCAIRHGVQLGLDVTAFEQNNDVGGTWIYEDQIGNDEYGVEIHSSMYEGLRTNLPKETIEFPDFSFPSSDNSYPTSDRVLNYFKLYADEFKLRDKIKFHHQVIQVRVLQDDKWEVIVKNLTADSYLTITFDAVIVCNGFSVPLILKISGHEVFRGLQIHTHNYRCAEPFKGERVLLIGNGPSGFDMALAIGEVASHVSWSNHMFKSYGRDLNIKLNVQYKGSVDRLTEIGAIFDDGTTENFTAIVYATGFDYKFPFLSVDCGLSCDDKHIQPLFKHCININQPTMAIISLPYFALAMPMYDLQVRFFFTFLTGKKKLPTKAEMIKDREKDQENRKKLGLPNHKAHFMGPQFHEAYYDDITKTAGLKPLPPVICKMFNKGILNLFGNFNEFKKKNFRIIDDENFEEI
jgi:dimethylaniline monooxygenase (N-oxide forming)